MKRTAIFLLLGMAACALPMSAETPNQRKAVARRVFEEIFNQGKFDVADQIYAKDFVNHGVTRDIGLKEDQAAESQPMSGPNPEASVPKRTFSGNWASQPSSTRASCAGGWMRSMTEKSR